MEVADTSTLDTTIATPPPPEAQQPMTPTEPSAPGAVAAPEKVPEPPKTRREAIEKAVRAQAAPTEGKSLRDKMIEQGVIRPAGEKPRAPDGKFVPVQPGAVKAAPVQAIATPAPATVPLPKALRQELAPVWAKTDPAMQAAIAKYVEDASKGIEIHKTKATLRAEGGTPQRAIRDLLNTAYVLRTAPESQKAALIAQTMRSFNISPDALSQALQGGVQQSQQQADPRYDQLQQQVQSLSALLNGQQERHYTNIADSFGREKPHWELLKPHVAGILSRGEIDNAESMTETQILDAAYTRALQQYPVVSTADAEAQRQAALRAERDKANAAAAASRAAAVQVTGAPGGQAAPAFDPTDRRSVLSHALRTAHR